MDAFSLLMLYLSGKRMFKLLVYEMDGETEPKFYSFHLDENVFFSTYKSFMMYAFENAIKIIDTVLTKSDFEFVKRGNVIKGFDGYYKAIGDI